jgi:phage terminase Nu1 subunit (DNA packaging protein)
MLEGWLLQLVDLGAHILNKADLANILGCHYRTIENYQRDGCIMAIRKGKAVAYDLRDVLMRLVENRGKPGLLKEDV